MIGLPDRVARGLPALLLLAVAANQLRLSHSYDLSPWSGGGFGMFSSTDSPASRHLHVFVQNAGIRRELFIPVELEDDARRAAALPTRARLDALAAALASAEDGGRVRWDELEIQVWAVVHERESLTPGGVLLRRERFRLGDR